MPPKKRNVKSTQPARQSSRLRGISSSADPPVPPNVLDHQNLPDDRNSAAIAEIVDPSPAPTEIMGNAVGTPSPTANKNEGISAGIYKGCDEEEEKYDNILDEQQEQRGLFSKKNNIREDEKNDDDADADNDADVENYDDLKDGSIANDDSSTSEYKPKDDHSDEDYSDQNLDETYDLFESEDFLNDLMAETNEDGNDSKPKANRTPKGKKDLGPQKPDVAGMSTSEAEQAMREWKIARKAYTDNLNHLRKKGSHILEGVVDYSGDQSPTIRKMTVVEQRHLVVGHNFPTRSLLLLRIAEEANLRFIPISIIRSDNRQLLVIGDQFYVRGSCSDKHGWVATKVVCRLDDKGVIPVISSPARAKKRLIKARVRLTTMTRAITRRKRGRHRNRARRSMLSGWFH